MNTVGLVQNEMLIIMQFIEIKEKTQYAEFHNDSVFLKTPEHFQCE